MRFGGTCTHSGIRGILKSYKDNRGVSNFPPPVAKYIYDILLKENSSVFDFCSGFGGRMLGALSSSNVIKYVGIDALKENCDGVEKMAIDLNSDNKEIKIINDVAENAINHINDKFDMVFTSPPYFDNEIYSRNDINQSCCKYNKYGDWFNLWLLPLIEKSFDKLKEGGYLVLSLGKDSSGRDITEDIKARLKYNLVRTFLMQTGVNEYLRKKETKKYFPILVYQK